jgi:hypothetical protein
LRTEKCLSTNFGTSSTTSCLKFIASTSLGFHEYYDAFIGKYGKRPDDVANGNDSPASETDVETFVFPDFHVAGDGSQSDKCRRSMTPQPPGQATLCPIFTWLAIEHNTAFHAADETAAARAKPLSAGGEEGRKARMSSAKTATASRLMAPQFDADVARAKSLSTRPQGGGDGGGGSSKSGRPPPPTRSVGLIATRATSRIP